MACLLQYGATLLTPAGYEPAVAKPRSFQLQQVGGWHQSSRLRAWESESVKRLVRKELPLFPLALLQKILQHDPHHLRPAEPADRQPIQRIHFILR